MALVPPAWATAATPLVLRGVTVIDVARGTRVPDQTVIIVGRRIQALSLARRTPTPAGAHVIDARGKYLIPGLWDMHIHLLAAPATVGYPLLIANGVTGVRDPGSSVPLATTNRWKAEIAAGARVGPRLFVAGPAVERECLPIAAHQVCVSTPAEARLMVDLLKESGADFIKTYILDSRELYFALAGEAKRVGIPFGGHLPEIGVGDGVVHGLEASDSGARFLDHGTYLTPDACGGPFAAAGASGVEQCAAVAERFRRNGTWVVPTLGVGLSLPYYRDLVRRYFPQELVKASGQSRDSALAGFGVGADTGSATRKAVRPASLAEWTAAASRFDSATGKMQLALPDRTAWKLREAAGLPMVLGTDAVLGRSMFFGLPGFTLHNALVALVLGGMSPLGALQMATINPARAIDAADSLGTVAAGKLADLVVLDADPLADITNTAKIRAVVTDGHYYDRAALDRLLRRAEQEAHQGSQ